MKLLLIAVLALAVLSIGAQPTRTQWEYKTHERCYDDGSINKLGAEGWELAGFSETDGGAWHCVFKRPR